MNNILSVLRTEVRERVIERCGAGVVADGLECPNCGAYETYKAAGEPENVDRWVFIIRAYRVDDQSECRNCGKWFGEDAELSSALNARNEPPAVVYEKSAKHITFATSVDGITWEWYVVGEDIHRAPVDSPVMPDGRRSGRFEYPNREPFLSHLSSGWNGVSFENEWSQK